MGTSAEFSVTDKWSSDYLRVSHDGYPEVFGIDVLNVLRSVVDSHGDFGFALYKFGKELGEIITPFGVGAEWTYDVDMQSKTLTVVGYTSYEGERRRAEWSLDELPTDAQLLAAFCDDPEVVDEHASSEW